MQTYGLSVFRLQEFFRRMLRVEIAADTAFQLNIVFVDVRLRRRLVAVEVCGVWPVAEAPEVIGTIVVRVADVWAY